MKQLEKKLYLTFLTAVLILNIAMAGLGKAYPEPIILQVEPKSNKAEPGETFSVNITVTGIVISETSPMSNGLFGWDAWMTFNPKVLHAINATESSFLRDATSTYGYTTVSTKMINNTEGKVNVGETVAFKMPPDDPYPPEGATGDGTLATITFEVMAEGQTDVHFETPTEKAKTNLYTVVANNLVAMSYTAEDGVFDNRAFVLSTELIVAVVVVVAVIVCSAAVFFYRRRKASAGT